MTTDTGAALLAIDPPGRSGRQDFALPCQVFDQHFRPLGRLLADGISRAVPSGLVILVVSSPDGPPLRKVLQLEANGRYRLTFFQRTSRRLTAAGNLNDDALRIVTYLESGRVPEARILANIHLEQLQKYGLGDPLLAAAVGYVLLQTWEWNLLGPWCLDLPFEYPGFADGFVIVGELYAGVGDHAVAINYFRQLQYKSLPTLTLGLSQVLRRLSAYCSMKDLDPPSVRLRKGPLREQHDAPPWFLSRWDIEDACATYLNLTSRSEDIDFEDQVTHTAVEEASPRGLKALRPLILRSFKTLAPNSERRKSDGHTR